MIDVDFVWLGSGLGALGGAMYLRDTLRGTVQPNRVTWLLWAVAPLLASAVELDEGVGLRTMTTFVAGFMPLLVFLASFHSAGAAWKVGWLDYVCGALSAGGTIGWLLTRSGVVAIAAAVLADGLAAVPTLVKSWTHPKTESVSSYAGALANAAILLLTVTTWTTAVVAFPIYLVAIASVEVVLVGARPGTRWRAARARRALAC